MNLYGRHIILHWRQYWLKRNFYPPHLPLPSIPRRICLTHYKRVWETSFFWPTYMGGQATNYWTSALLIIVECLAEAPRCLALWLFSSECHANLSFPFCLWNSRLCGDSGSVLYVGVPIRACVIIFGYFLSLIYLTFSWLLDQRNLRRVKERFFLPHKQSL